jgi:hypothetical protein
MNQTNFAPGGLAWDHAVEDIPPCGLRAERAAEPGELAAIAGALDLIACSRLTARYLVAPAARESFRVTGRLEACVEQACVVSLEPVGAEIAEDFDVLFSPAEDIPAPTSGEVDWDGDLDPEPIVGGRIQVGRVIFECLATAIEPFPRKPDAILERHSTGPEGGDGGGAQSPFAILASFRSKD